MKKKKLKDLIQGPLRFYHQDIHEELDNIKFILEQLSRETLEMKNEISNIKGKEVKPKGCSKCGTNVTPLKNCNSSDEIQN
jgi:hypothetical protein